MPCRHRQFRVRHFLVVLFLSSLTFCLWLNHWGDNKEAETLTQKGGELGYRKKYGSAIVTSKPTNQKNTNAILSRASRKAIGPRPVPDVANSNQHHIRDKNISVVPKKPGESIEDVVHLVWV